MQRERWKIWLEDRTAHRKPVDDHFWEAMDWAKVHASNALELGPGSEIDLTRALERREIRVLRADVVPLPDTIDISFEWETEGRLPWPDDGFDLVLAREVMEHIPDIFQMVREIQRVLKPGGRFWFTTPFVFPLHDYDTGDYWRLTPKAWQWLLRQAGFRHLEIKPERELWGSWQYPVTVRGWAEK
jgi:SAM-dependent methyltransferase